MKERARCSLCLRWLRFNLVGAIGIGVQLGTLALLVGALKLATLPATALAVEAALLHNFFWHERYTWSDCTQPAKSLFLTRLLHFHLTTGVISLLGNLAMMQLLVKNFAVHYLLASCVSIAGCSLLNFAASHAFVFRRVAGNR